MRILNVLFLLLIAFQVGAQQTLCPIIPAPEEAVAQAATFKLNKQTALVWNDPSLATVAAYIQQELLRLKSLPLTRQTAKTNRSAIVLQLKNGAADDESYRLTMCSGAITIEGQSVAGICNGASSLVQLIAGQKEIKEEIELPCWNIKDRPRYAWRGLMLDESRYFIGKEKLLSLLDWMAFYKLNKLHWHLTDEPAWRIEIRKYPKLALLGGVGDYNDPKKPAAFYSQREIAEIVDYATNRNITIIPEIDMPGHATAANRAYPQYSGGGNPQHPDFTFDPGKEETYTYLANILRETNALFPSGMLHLGGDEVSFGTDKWSQNEGIKRLMKQHQLKNLKDVEHAFMERMADSVYQLNAKLLVWDEMADINLPKEKTVIFWWRHDKPEQLQTALSKGYQTVLCPRLPFYFDFVQDSTHHAGRKWGKKISSMQSVYHFNADSLLTETVKNQVLGIQANLWTETVTNLQRVDYLLFPRIAALAEVAWSRDGRKNYDQFIARLKQQLPLYREQNIYFYNPFDPTEIPEPVYFKKDRKDLNAEEN
ncbi:beta-N-acetylhexosaminidase [Olivibacter ginsenosidimutans]|uniref:beta-N-acetylhexosaminidase n=1 Tax=Olivibacter ginsenosidimutans TaxID=1176537 RepID=A0ABP9BYK5_9SPHI